MIDTIILVLLTLIASLTTLVLVRPFLLSIALEIWNPLNDPYCDKYWREWCKDFKDGVNGDWVLHGWLSYLEEYNKYLRLILKPLVCRLCFFNWVSIFYFILLIMNIQEFTLTAVTVWAFTHLGTIFYIGKANA